MSIYKVHDFQLRGYIATKCDNQYSLLTLDIYGFTSLDPLEVVFIIQSQWQRKKPAAKLYQIILNQCLLPTILTHIPAVVNLKPILRNRLVLRNDQEAQAGASERNVHPCPVILSVNAARKWRVLLSMWLRMKAINVSRTANI